jgi:hypothetical protein
MNDWAFFILASEHILLLVFSFILAIGLSALAAYKFLGYSFYNPFHYFFTVALGFGYGVVFFLMFLNLLTPLSYYIVFGFGILFIFAYKYFLANRFGFSVFNKWINQVSLPEQFRKTYFFYLTAIYLFLVVVIAISKGGLTLQQESRFEANAGIGPIVRFSEFIKYVLLSLSAIQLLQGIKYKNVQAILANIVFLVVLIYVSSLVNGSKGAFLECLYAIVFVNILSVYRLKLKTKYILLFGVFFLCVALGWTYYTLSQNLLAFDVDASVESSQYFSGTGFLTEKFLLRLLAYGDMYFYTLPNDVITHIQIDNVFFRFVQPLTGSGVLNSVFHTNVTDMELGRQIMLYWL